MTELSIAEDGRYIEGDIPFGYKLWGDRLVEIPAELDACVTILRLRKQGKEYDETAAAVRDMHGVELSRAQYDGLIESAYRRYGPI